MLSFIERKKISTANALQDLIPTVNKLQVNLILFQDVFNTLGQEPLHLPQIVVVG